MSIEESKLKAQNSPLNMAETSKKLHIAVFPWLAFGHMIPFLDLSKLIAQKGHRISFISTPRNIQRLPRIPTNLSPLISFVSLSLPHEDNLPQDAEATSDLPSHKLVPYLKTAFDNLQVSLSEFLQTSSPDWIIYDFAPHWLPPIAAKLGISRAYFSVFQAWSICFLGSSSSAMINGEDPLTKPEHFIVPPKWIPFHSNLAYRLYEAKRLVDVSVEANTSGVNDLFRAGSILAGCDVITLRSCMELESEWLNLLSELHGKPVVPVGLLPPAILDSRSESEDNAWVKISEWLGEQKAGSVVYVALGSEVNLSQAEVNELALGLELSGLPFFWVLRKREYDSVELPDGFQERVKGRGVVWTSWAPQLRILDHESVGAFLSHCGSSSVIESLHFGRPIIMLPFANDQGLNARVFAEKKVGIEIKRNDEDGYFTRSSVAESMRLVIIEVEGKVYRDKAKEMRVTVADTDLQNRYIDKFVKFLENRSRQITNDFN